MYVCHVLLVDLQLLGETGLSFLYIYVLFIHSNIHTYIQLIASSSACWMISRRLTIEFYSYTLAAHSYIHICAYATIVEERGQGRGRLTLSLASR